MSNAEVVIRSQIQPGATRCYQKGLETDPGQGGKLVIGIKIAPTGEVDSVTTFINTRLAPMVVACIESVARRATFDPVGETGRTISVPFNFLKAASGSPVPNFQ
jgi:hypothetical protein